MNSKLSLLFFEKVEFSQKFDRYIVYSSSFSKLFQVTSGILSTAQIFQKTLIENLISSRSNSGSINIVRLYLNIDWKFKDCFHNTLNYSLKLLYRFRPFSVIVRRSTHFPSGPGQVTRVKEHDTKSKFYS